MDRRFRMNCLILDQSLIATLAYLIDGLVTGNLLTNKLGYRD
jgi:hypothetical protein